MPTLLENSTILTPFEEIKDSAVLVDDNGLIAAVDKTTSFKDTDAQRIDLNGKYLIPGFIDIHVHGGHGTTFGVGDLARETARLFAMDRFFWRNRIHHNHRRSNRRCPGENHQGICKIIAGHLQRRPTAGTASGRAVPES